MLLHKLSRSELRKALSSRRKQLHLLPLLLLLGLTRDRPRLKLRRINLLLSVRNFVTIEPKKAAAAGQKASASKKADEEEEEKMVYGLKKGGAVVDHHMPNSNQYKVVVEGSTIYNRHLMKSNVERNNNKVKQGK